LDRGKQFGPAPRCACALSPGLTNMPHSPDSRSQQRGSGPSASTNAARAVSEGGLHWTDSFPFLRQRPTRKSGSQRAARNPREASHEPHDRLSHKTYVPRLLCPFALGCDCLGSHGIARAGNLEPSPSTVVGSSDFGRGCTGVAALDCRACAHCISEARTPGVRPIIAPVSFAAALLRSCSAPQLVTIGKPPQTVAYVCAIGRTDMGLHNFVFRCGDWVAVAAVPP
jgi:hypothetical protein